MSHGLVTNAPITREQLDALRDEPVHIVGAASAEGIAVLRLLRARGFQHVTMHDMRPRAELRRAFRTTHGAYSRAEQDELWNELSPVLDSGCYDTAYLSGIEDARLVVLGQGWYLDRVNRHQLVERVPEQAVVTSMTALYFALHRGPIAAITGTNGKSTTVALTEHLLTTAGVAFCSAGNERSSRQFLPHIDEIAPGTWGLLEVSNRQLLQLDHSPQVAAITSLTPDHLDEHDGFAGYRNVKAQLFAHQGPRDIAIANADDANALEAASASVGARTGRLVRCGTADHAAPNVTWCDGVLMAHDVPMFGSGDGRRDGAHVIASRADLQLPGVHNERNAAVAVALALAMGADPSRIAEGLRTFVGKALRLQRLDVIDGVSVWSDLKSTTPEATVAAVEALASMADVGRVVLVAGGDDKGLDYDRLGHVLRAVGVRVIAVPGSATDKLERAWNEADPAALPALRSGDVPAGSFERVDRLERALDAAFDRAASGDAVIVSPAAAGFWTRQLQGSMSLRRLVRRRATKQREEVTS